MIQKVLVTPIVGLPQMNGWAQVTSNHDGTFMAAFCVSGLQAGNVGRDLVDLISESSPNSAPTVYNLMKKIVRFAWDKDCVVQISAGYVGGEKTVFSSVGGAVLLKRGEKLGCVLLADDEVKLIEGKKNAGDVAILMSGAALPFKEEIFQKLAQGLDVDTTVTSIVPGVQNLPDSSLVAMAFLTEVVLEEEVVSSAPLVQFVGDDEVVGGESGAGDANMLAVGVTHLGGAPAVPKSSFVSRVIFGQKKVWMVVRPGLKTLGRFSLRIGSGLLKNLRRLFGSSFLGRIYVVEKFKLLKIKKWLWAVVAFLVFGVVLVAFFFLKNRFDLAAAVKQTTSARETIKILQASSNDDLIAKREALVEVVMGLEALEKSFVSKPAAQKYVKKLAEETKSYYDSISGKKVQNELDIFFDFGLVKSNFIAHRALVKAGVAYFLDKDSKQLIQLDLTSKKFVLYDLGGLTNITDFGLDEEQFLFLGDGVYARGIEASASAKQVVSPGKANNGALALNVFNRNLYVLSQSERNVFKYSFDQEKEEFGEPVRWVKSAKELDFANVTSLLVDGEVWLSTKLGQIFRLSAGAGSLFEVRGLTEPFKSQLYLYTDEESNNLYVLEPASSRLVVIKKDGEFVKEVTSQSLAAGNGLVVEEKLGRAFIISGSLVFTVGL